MDSELYALASRVGEQLLAAGMRLCLAESCTGGWMAKVCTDVPGSSMWFDGGFVTYSNDAKVQMLDIDARIIAQDGAVSETVVKGMAAKALQKSSAQVAVAISGIAGPDGGTSEKPVGLVWFAWGFQNKNTITRREVFSGDREQVRRQSVRMALQGVLDGLG